MTVESWAGFSTVPAPRTAVALAARHRSADAALGRVRDAIIRLRRERTQVSVAAVARRANVSRTFLYDHPDARAAVAAVMAEAGERRTQMVTDQDEAHEATWRERALNAEDALRAAHAEIIAQQRTRNGELLRQVGDLEAEWTQEANQRITTENTTLKQRAIQSETRRPSTGAPIDSRPGPSDSHSDERYRWAPIHRRGPAVYESPQFRAGIRAPAVGKVDELHNLDIGTRAGAEASDQIKYLSERIPGPQRETDRVTAGLRALPLAPPPVHGETIGSYLNRLVDANHLTIGHLTSLIGPSRQHRRDEPSRLRDL
ncbi:DUF6262 family protein [Streptomyces sp. MMG1533]|uniref:DUF6262 family protein n=1 Tax=Streptomyces sp. MMG1533 TaxID=1415546 RepID=UPI001F382144|nr:DUF6262 family protein [Streptomyces sp. MMG1533]